MPLPLGLLSADCIVTVSPTYAQQILTSENGNGLVDFLVARKAKINGILNGIDTQRWNPVTDEILNARYGVRELRLRVENKLALQHEFDLERNLDLPLLTMVSRLDQQKGVDLVPEALRQFVSSPAGSSQSWQLIILGTGSPDLEDALRELEEEFPTRVRSSIRFDNALSHRLFGGSDALLIPSRYEPCGLTQLIAMRYGCVPVAHATGGLVDTIKDFEETAESTGFLFEDSTSESLAIGLGRALKVYMDRKAWRALQRRGMEGDYSWESSAYKYLELYQYMIEDRNARMGVPE